MAEASIRPEIWSVTHAHFDIGEWDMAVFEALKTVEKAIQDRLGSRAIGDALVHDAFEVGASGARIRVSNETLDQRRLDQLFSSSIGFFKGDRSHGETAVPCRSADECLRILAHASVLLDLLDRDKNIAPAIRGVRQEDVDILELAVERIAGSPDVKLDGRKLEVISASGDLFRVRLGEPLSGLHVVSVKDDVGRDSDPFAVYLWNTLPAEHWHRVVEAGLPLFEDEACTRSRPENAVRLLSHEGERQIHRVFPTNKTYQAGRYVTWEWEDSGESVTESWTRTADGTGYAFTSSLFFSGQELAAPGEPRLIAIELRPRMALARPGESLPVSVVGYHSDGIGRWRTDETQRARLTTSDETIAYVDPRGAVRANVGGVAEIRAELETHFSRASVNVGSHPAGQIVEYVGGVQNPIHVEWSPHGLLITNQSDVIRVVDDFPKLRILARVDIPGGVPGLDEVASDGQGNLESADVVYEPPEGP